MDFERMTEEEIKQYLAEERYDEARLQELEEMEE